MTHSQSSASPIAPAFTSPDSFPLDESESDDGSDLGELAATMDKLRLFDASFYFGKGTMLFTQTDTEKFWDEEISFDVHEAPDIDIPPEALVVPPLDVIDALFDIYYSVRSVFWFLRSPIYIPDFELTKQRNLLCVICSITTCLCR